MQCLTLSLLTDSSQSILLKWPPESGREPRQGANSGSFCKGVLVGGGEVNPPSDALCSLLSGYLSNSSFRNTHHCEITGYSASRKFVQGGSKKQCSDKIKLVSSPRLVSIELISLYSHIDYLFTFENEQYFE